MNCISYSRSLQHWGYSCYFYFFFLLISKYYTYTALYYIIQGECSLHLFLLCNPAQRMLYNVAVEHKSLFYTTGGVQTDDLFMLHTLTNTITIFNSFFLYPVLDSIPSFLNVTVLHDSAFKKSFYRQTSN
jgi:hypothetical protein